MTLKNNYAYEQALRNISQAVNRIEAAKHNEGRSFEDQKTLANYYLEVARQYTELLRLEIENDKNK